MQDLGDLKPYQIVSLWDMLKAYAYIFYLIGDLLHGTSRAIEMVKNPNVPLRSNRSILASLQSMRDICKDVNVPVTMKGIDWTEKEINQEGITYRRLAEVLGELGRRTQDELSSILFFHVPSNRADYCPVQNKTRAKCELLTEIAKKKFPRSIEDSDEAGKCFALGRYTACVFHLMRVMERGVQRLGKKLAVTIPVEEKDWGLISNHINGALKKLPNSTPQEKRVHARFAKAAVYLDNVREAWRNPTMHPKETYTEEEAENAFRFVKQYVDYLATIV